MRQFGGPLVYGHLFYLLIVFQFVFQSKYYLFFSTIIFFTLYCRFFSKGNFLLPRSLRIRCSIPCGSFTRSSLLNHWDIEGFSSFVTWRNLSKSKCALKKIPVCLCRRKSNCSYVVPTYFIFSFYMKPFNLFFFI